MTDPQQPGPNYSSPSPAPAAGGAPQPSDGPAPDYNAPSAYANYQGQPNYGQGQPGYAPQPNNYAPYQGYQPPGGLYHQAPAKPKSPILGIVALALALLGSIVMMYPFGWIDLVASQDLADSLQVNPNTPTPAWLREAVAFFTPGAIVGFAGFVCSIIAIVVKRGRVWGIVGLIGCVVFPFLLMILFIAMNPTLAAVV